MAVQSFTITPRGPFSLTEAANFGFGQRDDGDFDGVMRLAFCLDGYGGQVGVELRQDDAPDGAGPVHAVVQTAGRVDLDRVQRQVARVLSLDYDGAQFLLVGERDPVIGRLQAAAPGLRPPLFYSPYEAAAWSVLSSRRPARQMMAVRDRMNEAYGVTFDLAGRPLAAFPTPSALLEVGSFPGIPDDKLHRLHGVASAALDGRLDVDHLQRLGPEQATVDLQAISGIGPFYSSLIVIRGTGFADILPVSEPKALALAARLYGLDAAPEPERFSELAEPWRPFRTWATVLIRAAAHRILDEPGPAAR